MGFDENAARYLVAFGFKPNPSGHEQRATYNRTLAIGTVETDSLAVKHTKQLGLCKRIAQA